LFQGVRFQHSNWLNHTITGFTLYSLYNKLNLLLVLTCNLLSRPWKIARYAGLIISTRNHTNIQ